jgi:hypothetical protein
MVYVACCNVNRTKRYASSQRTPRSAGNPVVSVTEEVIPAPGTGNLS